MNGKLTRVLCAAAAGIALAATGVASTGAAARVSTSAGGPVPVTAYVANQDSGTVSPIRIAANTALKPIKVGIWPFAIAITPDGETAYVANDLSNNVTPIRIATNTALKAIKVGYAPFAIAITPDGRTAYVANYNSDT